VSLSNQMAGFKGCLTIGLLLAVSSVAFAHPDFAVRPRNIENALPGNRVLSDTLVIVNAGDGELTWQLEVRADSADWISARPLEGAVGVGGWAIVVVRQDGRQLADGHYRATLHFTSNDPTAEEYDVPVLDHNIAYPRIEAFWGVPQMGEWWGLDMDRIVGPMEWGQSYGFDLTIGNRGSAQLDCDTIVCSNGNFTISPGVFSLDPGASRSVRVTFVAREMQANAGEITSRSNAWDPRELRFRITATVLPVFRRGGSLPDLTIDEDAAECVVADLDTVFLSSDGGTRIDVRPAYGLLTRLARNGELFVHSRPNWNGAAELIVIATTGDSVLADTCLITVRSVADAPDPFDLIAPNDGNTLSFDGGDSLLVWQSTQDPDGDTVRYTLRINLFGENDSLVVEDDSLVFETGLTDTIWSLHDIYYRPDLSGRFTWSVSAEGGGLSRDSWSTFSFFLEDGRQHVNGEKLPSTLDLLGTYPNPFNAGILIELKLHQQGIGNLTICDLEGRTLAVIYSGKLSAGEHQFQWFGAGLSSGVYLLRSDFGGGEAYRRIILLK